mmetsp:Transcript_87459/g.282532  ORF Transcript_87459/g.282532 Transcript_87459/m.282532 type:complete len:241 (-) Transcript_87459:106-828(-)
MPVFSKMTAKRTQGKTVVTGALCAGALVAASAPGFLAPQHAALRTVATTRADSTANALPVAGQGVQSTPASITAGATLGLAAAVLTSASTKSRAARRGGSPHAATSGDEHSQSSKLADDGSVGQLVAIAEAVLASRGHVDEEIAGRLFEFAATSLRSGWAHHEAAQRTVSDVIQGAAPAFAGSVEDRGRWAAAAAVSMLMAFTLDIQPASALDEVTYTEFLQQVQRGDVEMVRVEKDLTR